MHLYLLPESRYSESEALWRYCFGDDEDFISWYFRRRAKTVLAYGEADMVAQIAVVPITFSVRGEMRTASILSGIATHPCHRGRGIMEAFLPACHEYLRGQGVTAGLLYPFSYGFYRRYGWALTSDILLADIPLERLPLSKSSGRFESLMWSKPLSGEPGERIGGTLDAPLDALVELYERCYGRYSGHVARDATLWRMVLEELALDGGYAALYRRAGQWEGYLLYKVEGEVITIEELCAATIEARRDILSFIARHNSTQKRAVLRGAADDPIWRLIPDNRGLFTLEAHSMTRVLDLLSFVTDLPAREGMVVLRVADAYAPWNEGAWRFFATSDGRLRLEAAISSDALYTVSIESLTQWLMGYLSARELADMGMLPSELAPAMDALLPKVATFGFEKY